MPFDTDSARAAGQKGGKNRWVGKDPASNRTKQLQVKLTPAEFDAIDAKAKAAGLSRVDLIVRAVEAYPVTQPPKKS